MSGSATWMEKCPLCIGSGKIAIIEPKTKTIINSADNCFGCDGRGYIMVKKSILRKKA